MIIVSVEWIDGFYRAVAQRGSWIVDMGPARTDSYSANIDATVMWNLYCKAH